MFISRAKTEPKTNDSTSEQNDVNLSNMTYNSKKRIRTPKKGTYRRKTHFLQAQKGGNTLADQKKKVVKEHSQTKEQQGRDLSRGGKKGSLQGGLTI